MSYSEELVKAMKWLGEKPNTLFLGQQVEYDGNALFKSLHNVPAEKKIELPVAEDMQMGMGIGLSLAGRVPVLVYPRMNFLMCAMNQLVNHLDKLEVYSNGQYKPHVIIRVAVGSTKPMYPGVQHCGDYNIPLERVSTIRLKEDWNVLPAYQEAYYSKRSTVLIEYADLY